MIPGSTSTASKPPSTKPVIRWPRPKAWAKRRSGAALRALRALLELTPPQGTVRRNGVETMIDLHERRVADELLVRPGERIATDGVIISGHTAIDTARISGEAVPVEVGPGDVIIGGCVDTHGRLVVRATRVGADTQPAQIARLVTNARGPARLRCNGWPTGPRQSSCRS